MGSILTEAGGHILTEDGGLILDEAGKTDMGGGKSSIALLFAGACTHRRRAHRRQVAERKATLVERAAVCAEKVLQPQPLTEMSFKQLLQAAQQNGWYKQGGAMRLRNGIWVIDPSVPGRVENSRFVITKPPSITKAEDGGAIIYFSFKSRPDSSTTGQRARGYVRFLPDRRARYQFGNKVHCFCTCFAGNTGVLMADGTYKPIRDVQVGDMVMTHLGRPRTVLRTMQRVPDAAETYRVKVQGHPDSFITTGNHPFWTLRGNTHCLCGCGQELVRPKRSGWSPEMLLSRKCVQGHGGRPLRLPDQSGGRFEWVPVDEMQAHEWFLSPWVQPTHSYVSVNPDFARLAGYYAAEGCLHGRGSKRMVRITFNRNEWDTLAADVLTICRRLGMHARRSAPRNPDHQWCFVYIYSQEFRSFCQSSIPGKSLTKRLDQSVISWDDAAVAQLLAGMLLGDGDGRPARSRTSYYSSSPHLASQFQHLCNRLRLRNSLSYHSKPKPGRWYATKREGQAFISRSHPGWQVCLSHEAAAFFRSVIGDLKFVPVGARKRAVKFVPEEGQLRCLLARTPEPYQDLVYDLTVDEDHSFIVHGVAVHNCPDFKYHWAYVLARAGASHTPTGIGGEATNTPPSHTNPEGHLGICKHLAACSLYLTARSADYNKLITNMRSEPHTTPRAKKEPPKPVVPDDKKDVGPDGAPLEVAEVDPDIPNISGEDEP